MCGGALLNKREEEVGGSVGVDVKGILWQGSLVVVVMMHNGGRSWHWVTP